MLAVSNLVATASASNPLCNGTYTGSVSVLATGGTLLAAIALVAETGARVSEIVLLSEITELGGRARINSEYPEIRIHTLLS